MLCCSGGQYNLWASVSVQCILDQPAFASALGEDIVLAQAASKDHLVIKLNKSNITTWE